MCSSVRSWSIVHTDYSTRGFRSWGKGGGGAANELNRRAIVQQICAAMEAVSKAGVVHRDLAAHNVLVFSEQPICVKITDFGMSVDDPGHVRSKVETPSNRHESVDVIVSVRWAPPEILSAHAAWAAPWSEKSDVWSFGVTVWQVYSMGEVPYTLAMSDSAVKSRVMAGQVLPVPHGCAPEMMTFMNMCFTFKASDRPAFQGLKTVLDSMLM